MPVDKIIRLDEVEKAYGVFLRTIRVFRASIAVMAAAFVIWPIRAALFMVQHHYYSASVFIIELPAVLICSAALLYTQLTLFFFIAAASVSAAWTLLMLEAVILLIILGPTFPLALVQMIIGTIVHPSPYQVFNLLAMLFWLYLSYLLVIGLAQIV
jgi:hypothetical protein